jgi:hypothetical protein
VYLLAYVSVATIPFSESELIELLKKSREYNAARGITGLLLYNESNWLQLLEGSKEGVLALLDKIRSDPRHHGLIVVLQEEHSGREFPDWAMGFEKLDSSKPFRIPGYTDFHDLPLTSDQFLLNPAKSLQFLIYFKNLVHDGDYSQVQTQ